MLKNNDQETIVGVAYLHGLRNIRTWDILDMLPGAIFYAGDLVSREYNEEYLVAVNAARVQGPCCCIPEQ
jgi:hypothetical protein